ncbi:2og-fe oxygenase family protein [Phlyctema vagabunda]|uniref:2og-fe oxygenase family protein n=1 Tax=Phlyctema vagabunda TaxID=108571 RepID=A0ABR4PP95_9HELO
MSQFLVRNQTVGGQDVSIMTIPTISLAKLNKNDSHEIKELQNAASGIGFFYIDLFEDDIGEKILADMPEMYTASRNYFHQSNELKLKDVREDIKPSQDLGYKCSSCDETYEISWDAISTTRASGLPQVLQEYGDVIHRFSTLCHQVSLTMLTALSPPLLNNHRSTQPSNTGLKLISEPSLARLADVGDHTHTDGGTLTMLFYESLGLQSYHPIDDVWAFIPPWDGRVVINVADSLQRLSGETYHSPKHRITQVGDGAEERYYLSFFLRPEDALMDG